MEHNINLLNCRTSASEAMMSFGRHELHLQWCSVKKKGSVFHWQDYTNEDHNTVISLRNEKNKRTCWPWLARAAAAIRLINSWLYTHRLHSHLISCFNRTHCSAFVTPLRHRERDLSKSHSVGGWLFNQAWGNFQWESSKRARDAAESAGFSLTLIPWRAKFQVWFVFLSGELEANQTC